MPINTQDQPPMMYQGTSTWIISGGVNLGSPIPAGTNVIGLVNQGTNPWTTQTKFNAICLSGNTTTTIKSGVGVLHAITINTKGVSGNILKVCDSTLGAGILLAQVDTTVSITTLLYDVSFSNGLTCVLGTGTAANTTISYI